MKLIKIGDVAEMLGVSVKTIRRWEKTGKIDALYTPNGHRRYDEQYILDFVKSMKK